MFVEPLPWLVVWLAYFSLRLPVRGHIMAAELCGLSEICSLRPLWIKAF